jgi:hypothetical protein
MQHCEVEVENDFRRALSAEEKAHRAQCQIFYASCYAGILERHIKDGASAEHLLWLVSELKAALKGEKA